ncbi:MFS transporter [Actinacidiphila glaucinigra]|uniref:Fucose permease n=1 Tax=Actinacidiphila glaucinigra TaxID=235986 RepID=A0A239L1P0_9ACTN|nr:MFS transporter [Actinacidiphila glaucinigra]SNT24361.1 Fucose permease [Actinacidiphila glaucinigra]
MPSLNKIRSVLAGQDRASPPFPLRSLRVALTAFFALDGFVFAGWVVRIPAVKEQVGASAGALGLALLGVSAGAVVTMIPGGRLCRRFGARQVTVGTGAVLSLSVALPAFTHSPVTLGLVLLLLGVGFGGMNVAMNTVAVDLVAALRRPIMPGFHAAYSLGGLVGAGVGGPLAAWLTPAQHLVGVAAFGLVATVLLGRLLLRHAIPRPVEHSDPADPPAVAAEGVDGSVRPGGARRMVAVFGLIALCTAYGEGALAEWGPLHLQEDLHAGPALAAAGYAAVALAMTAGRLSGTALLLRLGPTRAVVLGGLTACAGMLLGAFGPTVWLVLTGFALTGLGLANVFPVAIGRAGALGGSGGVATASTLGYAGFLLGPPTIGFLADGFGLPVALTTVAALAAVAAVVAHTTRHASAAAGV